MRAKPEMQPWVHADKSGLSSEGAALSASRSEFIRSVVLPLKNIRALLNLRNLNGQKYIVYYLLLSELRSS